MSQGRTVEGFTLLADIPIDAVRTTPSGFSLEGRGGDRHDYLIDLRFEVPVDAKTRKVLGELLSQAELRISRREPAGASRTPG